MSRAPYSKGHFTIAPNRVSYGLNDGIACPEAEAASVTAVLEMAEGYLKFKPKDTFVYGYSLGGYCAGMSGDLLG